MSAIALRFIGMGIFLFAVRHMIADDIVANIEDFSITRGFPDLLLLLAIAMIVTGLVYRLFPNIFDACLQKWNYYFYAVVGISLFAIPLAFWIGILPEHLFVIFFGSAQVAVVVSVYFFALKLLRAGRGDTGGSDVG